MDVTKESELHPELQGVADAAGLVVEAAVDDGDVEAARARATEAAKAALDAGHSLSDVLAAERAGQLATDRRLRKDGLRQVERTAERMREATTLYEVAVGRAVDVGLSAREIALAAQVNHSTIIGIRRRRSAREETGVPPPQAAPPVSEPAEPS
jgi:DNA-binding NarL/FixJ family response regulator